MVVLLMADFMNTMSERKWPLMIDDMQVYIANLGKYNEGELVGDWFSFPLDEEVIAERIP